jgi:Putative auto-transporter adhesin, head GIN domain
MRYPLLFLLPLAVSAPALALETVPLPQFNAVELRGGGEVTLRQGATQRVTLLEGSSRFSDIRVEDEGKLRIDVCNDRCPSHYRLRILIESPRIPRTLAVAGGGRITATSGSVEKVLTLAVSGGGVIDTTAAPSEVVTAAVNGGGRINASSRNVLTAAVNGGGEVHYWGNPRVTTAIHGGGTIRPGS